VSIFFRKMLFGPANALRGSAPLMPVLVLLLAYVLGVGATLNTLNQCTTQAACTNITFNMLLDECSGNCMWEVCIDFDPHRAPVRNNVQDGYVCTQDGDCAGQSNWVDRGVVTNVSDCQKGLPGQTLLFTIFQTVPCVYTNYYFNQSYESSLGRPLDAVVSCQPAPGPQEGCGQPYVWWVPYCLFQVILPSGCNDIPNSPTPSPSPSFSPNATESPSPSLSPSPSPENPPCWEINGTVYCWKNCTRGWNETNATNATECIEVMQTPSPSPVTASESPSPVTASESPSPESPSNSPSPVSASESPSEKPTFSESPSEADSPSPLDSPSESQWPSESPSESPEPSESPNGFFETQPTPSPADTASPAPNPSPSPIPAAPLDSPSPAPDSSMPPASPPAAATPSPEPAQSASQSFSPQGPTFEVYPSDSPSPEGPIFEVYPSDSPSPEGPTFEVYPSPSPEPAAGGK